MKIIQLIALVLIISSSAYACNYDDCETRCENKFLEGGVPLWSCAEACAVCRG